MTGVRFLVLTLATWRLTSLFSQERGPLALVTQFRSLFGIHHELDGTPAFDETGEVLLNPVSEHPAIELAAHEVARGLTCFWCCSVWVAALIFGKRAWREVLAGSAAAIALQEWFDRAG